MLSISAIISEISVLIANKNCHCHHYHDYHDHYHHDQVRVTKRADGREENMRDLGRGDYFGEQVIL